MSRAARGRPWLLVSVALAAGLVAAGCSKTLDTGDLEQEAQTSISQSTGVTVELDCPDDVEAEAGTTFTCTARAADGSTAEFQVTQVDDDGNVEVKPATTLVSVPQAESQLEQELGAGVEVNCPETLLPIEEGTEFLCEGTGAGGEKLEVAVQLAQDGTFSYKVDPEG